MKAIINRLAHYASYLFLTPYYVWRKIKARPAAILIFSLLILSSCFQHYFRTSSTKKTDTATLQKLQNANKYFILHLKNTVLGLTNIKVAEDKLEADLIGLPVEHSKYLEPSMKRSNQVQNKIYPLVLMEVHLYYPETIAANQVHISIPITAINGMDVYEFDKSATTGNHILSWVGIGVGVFIVVPLIIAAIVCNCPQVYVNNNGQYEFQSGVYSGAIHSALERTDYLALPGITPVNDKYQFRIGNVPNEEQFINQVQLMKVEHPDNTKVLADRHGKILAYNNMLSPISASYDDGTDVTTQLKSTDGQDYLFNSKKNKDGFSAVTMKFTKVAGAKEGKLLVHAGNSNWSGFLFKEFVSLFGNNYEKWRSQQESAAVANAEQWQIDQGLPMKVFVETEKGWQYVDHFALTGNTASRDMIMEINLSGVKGNKVNIRIETAFQFWNLDMAAMDFSDNAVVNAVILNPSKVSKNNKEDNRNQLLQKDAVYTNLSGNDFVNIEYDVPPASGNASFFLVTSGYYHTKPPTSGKTDLHALLKFRKKGAFDRFSREKDVIIQNAFTTAMVK